MLPVDFKNYLNELGLVPVSTHQGGVTFDNVDKVIADVKAGGFKYFVIPIPPMGHFKYDNATRTMGMSDDIEFLTNFLNVVGKKCKEAGLELLYHNHDFEFEQFGDTNGYEILLNETELETFPIVFETLIKDFGKQKILSENINEMALPGATTAIVNEVEKLLKK